MRLQKDPRDHKQQIGSLLDKYRKILIPPQSSVEKEAAKVIGEMFGYEINAKSIKYTPSTKTLAINVPSVLKTEIRQRQEMLLRTLQMRLGEHNSPKTIL